MVRKPRAREYVLLDRADEYHEIQRRIGFVETNFLDEVKEFWGEEWGAQTEVGRLRKVFLHRPGEEVKAITDRYKYAWWGKKLPNLKLMQEQHDNMAKAYKENGVEVIELGEAYLNKAFTYFMRDSSVTVRGGSIVMRMAQERRKGEETVVTKRLAELGVPILHTIHGTGLFEGGSVLFINEKTVVLGMSYRCNKEGADQIESVLRRTGVEEALRVWVPGYGSHIDGSFNMADVNLAFVRQDVLPAWFIRHLEDTKIDFIPVPPEEANIVNSVVLRPGKIMSMAGDYPKTMKALEERGIDVVEVDISELRKGGGFVRCMSCPLVRDMITVK